MFYTFILASELIFIEFLLLAFVAITFLCLVPFLSIYTQSEEHQKVKLDKKLTKVILAQIDFNVREIQRISKELKIFIIVIDQIDDRANQYSKMPLLHEKYLFWSEVRTRLLQEIVAPIARRDAKSKDITDRMYATAALYLYAEKSDEELICELIADYSAYVSFNAGMTAVKYSMRKAIGLMISNMAKDYWLLQSSQLSAFSKIPQASFDIVEDYLQSSIDPNFKAACYNILAVLPVWDRYFDLEKDIDSDNLDLRIAAIKFLSYVKGQDAIPYLVSILNDPNWKIRLVALNRLGALHAKPALQDIAKCLNDDEWWIKVSAAKILTSFGDEGRQILRTLAPNVRFNYDERYYDPHVIY